LGGFAYYFQKNLQGDVIAITNSYGNVVARYTYDAWGVCTVVSDETGIIARVNPYRYRSYYYDSEIGLYYLQSRYYDPTVGRFVNGDSPDVIPAASWSSNCLNSFSYCKNNAVNMLDYSGRWPWKISWTISRDTLASLIDITLPLVSGLAKYAYDLIGLGLKAHAKRKGYVAVIDKLMGTVPKIVSWASRFLTKLRTVLWRIGAIALGDMLSKFVSEFMTRCAEWVDMLNEEIKKPSKYAKIVKIIICFFSTGGIIALFLDHITDGVINEVIKVF